MSFHPCKLILVDKKSKVGSTNQEEKDQYSKSKRAGNFINRQFKAENIAAFKHIKIFHLIVISEMITSLNVCFCESVRHRINHSVKKK